MWLQELLNEWVGDEEKLLQNVRAKYQESTAARAETDVGIFLSGLETGSPGRVQTSVPRVCVALACTWPDPEQWVAELKGFEKDGILSAFLQSIVDNPG